jgi:hypothetical protein
MENIAQIYDDYIPLDWCQSLENILLKNDTINLFDFGKNSDKRWVHNYSTAPLLFENEKQKDSFQHTSLILDGKDFRDTAVTNFFATFFSWMPFGVDGIMRIKANYTTPKINFTTENYQNIHTDNNKETFSILLYVSESDGDTFLFDKEGKNVIDHIPYKRGRVAVIPSTTPHAGQFPTKHNSRLVINSIVQKIVDKNVVEGRDEPGTGDNFFTEKKIKLYK